MSKPATIVDIAAFKKQLADSLERSAKSAGQTIAKETLTCEIAASFQVVAAALKRDELPTEKEFTAGIDLLYAYVSIAGQRALPAGFYRVRVAFPGYEKKGAVKVTFLDANGKAVHSVTGKGAPKLPGQDTDDLNITPFYTVCGSKKCFHICRDGFLDWNWECTDKSGRKINCVDRMQ